jgi:hypothetical protein
MKKTYILKNNAPVVGVDDFNKIPQNLIKPGMSAANVCQRQYAYSRIAKSTGYGDCAMNVLAVAENPKSGAYELEQLLHDKLGPHRMRVSNEQGGTTRELAKDVPLQDQILLICLLAQGTVEQIDSEDSARFTPTSTGMRWAYKKIRQFDIAVVEEGFNYLPYGRNVRNLCGDNYWEDGVWEASNFPNNSVKAHQLTIKFNPRNMPVAFNFCKYKPKSFAIA